MSQIAIEFVCTAHHFSVLRVQHPHHTGRQSQPNRILIKEKKEQLTQNSAMVTQHTIQSDSSHQTNKYVSSVNFPMIVYELVMYWLLVTFTKFLGISI